MGVTYGVTRKTPVKKKATPARARSTVITGKGWGNEQMNAQPYLKAIANANLGQGYDIAASRSNKSYQDWYKATSNPMGAGPAAAPRPTGPGGGGGGGGGGRGYGGGGGGGGGGGSFAGLDQGSYDYMMNALRASKPVAYTPKEYTSTFREFNDGGIGKLQAQVDPLIEADRQKGMASFAGARTELDQYQNPFQQGAVAQQPGMTEAMQRMLAANGGVGMDQAMETQAEGTQQNQGMQALLQALAGVDQQRQASNYRALEGDQRTFNMDMDTAARTSKLTLDMQLAKARQQYEIDKFEFGEEIARTNYQAAENAAYQNVQAQNSWTQALPAQLLELISGGVVNGAQTLNLGALPA